MELERDIHNQQDSQKELLKKHHKEHGQSLKYASFIQKSLLPSRDEFKRIFPEHFILLLPKDVVSGDFYWAYKRKNETIIAVADCTGHGVPGAFMSILGINFLNQIIYTKCYNSAAGILNMLREFVMKALNQKGEEDEPKDGIDMALCIIDNETNKLEFAGAFNPLYIVKKNNLVEIPGDKMPIGIAAFEETSFKNHVVDLNNGDSIYLFTDGFVDQFGGPDGKKYKYNQFRRLLLEMNSLSMTEQKERLIKTYDTWRGNLIQLDDVLVIGIRYHCSGNNLP